MTPRTDNRSRCAVFVFFLAILFAAPAIAGPLETYLALGDSIAFGQTDIIPVSLGDQDYVTLYADFLAKQNAGVRPNVANLAFPGDQHELLHRRLAVRTSSAQCARFIQSELSGRSS